MKSAESFFGQKKKEKKNQTAGASAYFSSWQWSARGGAKMHPAGASSESGARAMMTPPRARAEGLASPAGSWRSPAGVMTTPVSEGAQAFGGSPGAGEVVPATPEETPTLPPPAAAKKKIITRCVIATLRRSRAFGVRRRAPSPAPRSRSASNRQPPPPPILPPLSIRTAQAAARPGRARGSRPVHRRGGGDAPPPRRPPRRGGRRRPFPGEEAPAAPARGRALDVARTSRPLPPSGPGPGRRKSPLFSRALRVPPGGRHGSR